MKQDKDYSPVRKFPTLHHFRMKKLDQIKTTFPCFYHSLRIVTSSRIPNPKGQTLAELLLDFFNSACKYLHGELAGSFPLHIIQATEHEIGSQLMTCLGESNYKEGSDKPLLTFSDWREIKVIVQMDTEEHALRFGQSMVMSGTWRPQEPQVMVKIQMIACSPFLLKLLTDAPL